MRYMKLLSVRETFLLLFIRMVLVNRSILSNHVLWSIRRHDLLLSFCLGGSGCENVLSEIVLLDKIFKVLTEGPSLGSLVPLAVIKGAVVFRSGTSRVVLFCCWTLHPGLTLDGFEDVLIESFSRVKLSSTR